MIFAAGTPSSPRVPGRSMTSLQARDEPWPTPAAAPELHIGGPGRLAARFPSRPLLAFLLDDAGLGHKRIDLVDDREDPPAAQILQRLETRR